MPPFKLSTEQQDGIVNRYLAGESMAALAKEFNVNVMTIKRAVTRKGNPKRPEPKQKIPASGVGITEFAKRARSMLWRQDTTGEKTTFEDWKKRVAGLEESGGLTRNQAIVRASKEYKCLARLFREYDVSHFDPNPESHPTIQHYGKSAEQAGADVVCLGIEQSYRDSLRWAISAAGAFRRGVPPTECPCDAAWFLYMQAIEEPKDFMAKVGQMESKVDLEDEARMNATKESRHTISEINSYLKELDSYEKEESEQRKEADSQAYDVMRGATDIKKEIKEEDKKFTDRIGVR